MFDNMKSEIALAPGKIEEQELFYFLVPVTHLINISKVISVVPEAVLNIMFLLIPPSTVDW